MTETKDGPKGNGPILPADGTDTPKIEAPKPMKMGEAPAIPMIPKIDIDMPPPPPPGPEKRSDSPAKDDMIPMVTAPAITVPGPKPDVPPVVVGPMTDKTPEVKTPDIPTITIPGTVKPPTDTEPTIPPIVVKPEIPAPDRKKEHEEDWHTWRSGDTYALISQEYYHDARYAAALEKYVKEHRKSGDNFIRVPEEWRLKEMYPDLIGNGDKTDRSDGRTRGDGLKFEAVAPLQGDRRSAPPAAVSSRSSDEYKVTNESGELIRDVARKALGDAASWKKLYELNPGIDPTLPIPAGTTLRLR
jgi:nucleoid-associated protein YgaU